LAGGDAQYAEDILSAIAVHWFDTPPSAPRLSQGRRAGTRAQGKKSVDKGVRNRYVLCGVHRIAMARDPTTEAAEITEDGWMDTALREDG
jgi:hypothetical protein